MTPQLELASQAAFCGSVPQTCMHAQRPVIGLVEGVWWGRCHWIVVIPIRDLVVSDILYFEFDHAPQWEVATGASRCSAMVGA